MIAPNRRASVQACFVYAVLAISTISTLWLVSRTSPQLPKFDDWPAFVPVLTGHQDVTLQWLWSQHNEHRIPLPRLGYLLSYACTGGDFRAGQFLSVLIMAMIGLTTIEAARRLRGRIVWSDAFFPLMFLSWGQAHLFALGCALNFTMPFGFFFLGLLACLNLQDRWTLGRWILLTLAMVALPLCGMVGLVLAAPIGGLVLGLGIAAWKHDRRTAIRALISTGLLAGVAACYFIDYRPPGPPADAVATPPAFSHQQVESLGIILAMSFGCLGKDAWPISGVMVLAIALGTAVKLIASMSGGSVRPRLGFTLLAFQAGVCLLIAGIICGRTQISGEVLWATTRYATFSIALLAIGQLAWIISAKCSLARYFQYTLFVLAIVSFSASAFAPARYYYSVRFINGIKGEEDRFIRLVELGAPSSESVAAVPSLIHPEYLPFVEMFRQAGLGPYERSGSAAALDIRSAKSATGGSQRYPP